MQIVTAHYLSIIFQLNEHQAVVSKQSLACSQTASPYLHVVEYIGRVSYLIYVSMRHCV